ncbi:hypothetical protein [Sphingomicrobium nitratireducens]|uniref:hypothetical protein n=1 Tax=Sphingomicrobium nitratireducens TaxID=2964666 RepID=UPI00223EBD39|nr:hypothetical protein [Sphingomicrobium nitratireducens]
MRKFLLVSAFTLPLAACGGDKTEEEVVPTGNEAVAPIGEEGGDVTAIDAATNADAKLVDDLGIDDEDEGTGDGAE